MTIPAALWRPIVMTLEWPWLEFGAQGQDKRVCGFDLNVSTDGDATLGVTDAPLQASVFLYTNERDSTQKSDTVTLTVSDADTVPGSIMPLQAQAPTVGPSLTLQSTSSIAGSSPAQYPVIEFETLELYLIRGNEYT